MPWKQFKFLMPLVFSCVAILSITARAQEQLVGYVLAVEGDWRLNGKDRVVIGNAVKPGDKITANSDSNGKVTIALYDRTILFRGCPSAECKIPIIIPSVAKPDDPTKFLLEVLFIGNIEIDPPSPTRGKKLVDGVISKADGRVNLAPLLKGFDGETCELTFVQVASNGKPVATSQIKKSVDVPNPLQSSLLIPIPDLQPGLYQVKTPETSEALVLVAPEDKYLSLTKQMQQSNDLIMDWGKDKQVSLKQQRKYKWQALYSLAYPNSRNP